MKSFKTYVNEMRGEDHLPAISLKNKRKYLQVGIKNPGSPSSILALLRKHSAPNFMKARFLYYNPNQLLVWPAWSDTIHDSIAKAHDLVDGEHADGMLDYDNKTGQWKIQIYRDRVSNPKLLGGSRLIQTLIKREGAVVT